MYEVLSELLFPQCIALPACVCQEPEDVSSLMFLCKGAEVKFGVGICTETMSNLIGEVGELHHGNFYRIKTSVWVGTSICVKDHKDTSSHTGRKCSSCISPCFYYSANIEVKSPPG